MSIFVKGLLQKSWQPQLQSVRYKNKINVTKPRPSHFQRAIIEEICKPYFSKEKYKKPKHVPRYEICNIFQNDNTEMVHPLEAIVSNEARKKLSKSKLIAFFHKNELSQDEIFQYQVLLKNNGMNFVQYGRKTMERAVAGTIYEPILVFYQSYTVTVLCPEPEIHKLMKILKKMPKIILMGAVVENRILSLSELKQFEKLPNIESARSNFVAVLNSVSQNFVQKLNYPSNSIVQLLHQHQQVNGTKS